MRRVQRCAWNILQTPLPLILHSCVALDAEPTPRVQQHHEMSSGQRRIFVIIWRLLSARWCTQRWTTTTTVEVQTMVSVKGDRERKKERAMPFIFNLQVGIFNFNEIECYDWLRLRMM